MCTSVILFRKDNPWPIIIGTNRDELLLRKSKFPGMHWPKIYPNIIGGFDEEKKGTWIAINNNGMFSVIHNRRLDKDNNMKKKSRGHIILKLLNLDSIEEVAESLQKLNQSYYKGFNIIIGNKFHCFWAKHTSVDKKIELKDVPEGLSILANKDLNDLSDKKTYFYLNKFSQAPIPDPSKNDWLSWELLLATETIDNKIYPEEAICFINKKNNYGTKSSSLIAVSNNYSIKSLMNPIIFRASEGPPNISTYTNVDLD